MSRNEEAWDAIWWGWAWAGWAVAGVTVLLPSLYAILLHGFAVMGFVSWVSTFSDATPQVALTARRFIHHFIQRIGVELSRCVSALNHAQSVSEIKGCQQAQLDPDRLTTTAATE